MPALNEIQAATDHVAAAQTQLEELAAMVMLEHVVKGHCRALFNAATAHYSHAEIARALRVSRQSISQRAARHGRPAQSPDERNLL